MLNCRNVYQYIILFFKRHVPTRITRSRQNVTYPRDVYGFWILTKLNHDNRITTRKLINPGLVEAARSLVCCGVEKYRSAEAACLFQSHGRMENPQLRDAGNQQGRRLVPRQMLCWWWMVQLVR